MLIPLLVLLGALGQVALGAIKNTNAVRYIDLTASGIVREKISLAFSDEEQSTKTYDFAVPSSLARNLSSIAVIERRDRKAGAGEKLDVKLKEQRNDFDIFEVTLASSLEKESKSSFDISLVFTQVVRPLPKVVDQTDPQFLYFAANSYIGSVYPTEKQKTTIKLPSANLGSEAVAPQPLTRSGSTVTLGPYSNIGPLQYDPVKLHYEDNKPILVAKWFRKDLEISHLGSNIGVMESYDLHHRGAILRDSSFSRVDYQFTAFRHGQTNVLKELKVLLPGNVSNVYYRDDIGNVSTSNFRRGKFASQLLIRPRYPLYGGWRYSWQHTFDMPLVDYLKVDSSGERFRLEVPFIGSLKNITIEKAILSVALPDGARDSDVKVTSPFTADEEYIDIYYTNFDTIGRPRVFVIKKNVADEFAVPIIITYRFPSQLLYRKPIVLSSVVLGFLLFGMVAARLDFSIAKSEDSIRKDKVLLHFNEVVDLVKHFRHSLELLEKAFDLFKAKKDAETFQLESKKYKEALMADIAKLEAIAKLTSQIDKEFTASISELQKELKVQVDRTTSLHSAVVSFLSSPQSVADEAKTKVLQNLVADTEKFLSLSNAKVSNLTETIARRAK
ncbi:proteasome regulatory particle base subunit [Phlyctochytrium bullatum]|nr:proteasome regulatory particle base subunit [Phlyctochytrium bullatum]